MPGNPFSTVLSQLHASLLALDGGDIATYIPELGRANPDHFAISIATTDGHVSSAGDATVGFTIQSISKPFVYGLALDDAGLDAVLAKVGVEPSGEAFNAISLEPRTGRPRNPMINAGAIATASLVDGASSEERLDRTIAMFSAYAGRELSIDQAVFASEQETGHRNRAIGHLLRSAGILDGDVDEVVSRYFKQCSLLVTCEDLAVMAATLANGGRNPITGEEAVRPENVERILSVMSTCGMYDFSGGWVYRVGMPAKSGVAGGVIAVLPGQLGIGVFSPRLDTYGNSVRGVAVCEALSRQFGLHLLHPPVSLGSVVRRTYELAQVGSKRRRGPVERATLDAATGAAQIHELQGPLVLSTAERVVRHASTRFEAGQIVVFDLRRVSEVDPATASLLAAFASQVAEEDGVVAFSYVQGEAPWVGELTQDATLRDRDGALRFFADLDLALEWCEDEVLRRAGLATADTAAVAIASHPLLAGLDERELEAMTGICTRKVYPVGARLIWAGDPADRVFLLTSGSVEASLDLGMGRRHRLATFTPGVAVGDMALMGGGRRSADIDVTTEVVCYVFTLKALAALEGDFPLLRLKLVESIAHDLSDRLRRANTEIAALAG